MNNTVNFEPDPALENETLGDVITDASIDSIVNGSLYVNYYTSLTED